MRYKNFLAVSVIALSFSSNTLWSSTNTPEDFGLTEQEPKQQVNANFSSKNTNETILMSLPSIEEGKKEKFKKSFSPNFFYIFQSLKN